MAPLSGLRAHPSAPMWDRIGTFVYRHGERFYNFRGVRAYKGKFHPVWTPLSLSAGDDGRGRNVRTCHKEPFRVLSMS